VDSQRKLELFPSLCEDANELDESSFPDGPSENFDQELFPDISPGSGREKLECGVHLLEVRVASIGTLLNVFRDSLTKFLHPSLHGFAVRGGLLGIGNSI
jgi:hypothetical protein